MSVCQTDEDGEIYASVMQLRDETDQLQSELERRQKLGDVRGAEKYQQQLNTTQQLLLEKNRLRSVEFVLFAFLDLFFCRHHNRETVIYFQADK